jgi:hypothetical protein
LHCVGPFIIKVAITLISDEGGETFAYFTCDSSMVRDRWLEAFNPRKDDDDNYHTWECPAMKVIKDFPGKKAGDLPLVVGEIVDVEKTGEQFGRGRVRGKVEDPFAIRTNVGWFPMSHVQEITSHAKLARDSKDRASMKPMGRMPSNQGK